jgi:hypothetical protein
VKLDEPAPRAGPAADEKRPLVAAAKAAEHDTRVVKAFGEALIGSNKS